MHDRILTSAAICIAVSLPPPAAAAPRRLPPPRVFPGGEALSCSPGGSFGQPSRHRSHMHHRFTSACFRRPPAAFRREVGCDSHSSPSAVLPTKRRRCNQSLDRCQAAPSDSPLARIEFDLPPPASSARPPPSAARLGGASPLEPSRSSSGQTAPTQPVPGPLLERALPRIPTRIQLQRRGPPRASGGKAS